MSLDVFEAGFQSGVTTAGAFVDIDRKQMESIYKSALPGAIDTALKAAHAELERQFQTNPDAGYYQRKSDDTAHLDGTFDIRRLVEAIINGGER